MCCPNVWLPRLCAESCPQYSLEMGSEGDRAADGDARLVTKSPVRGAATDGNTLGMATHYLRSESDAGCRFLVEPRLGRAQALALQRQAGNAAVSGLLRSKTVLPLAVQRDDAGGGSGIDSGMDTGSTTDIPPAAQGLVGSQGQIDLTTPEPLEVSDTGPNTSGPGDFPMPGENGPSAPDQPPPTVMAFSGEFRSLQRDDDTPHPSADAAQQSGGSIAQTPGTPPPAPVQLNFAIIYRNLNLWQNAGKTWQVVHEPQIQIIGDSHATLSLQEAITLINIHWKEPWKSEIETGLSIFAQQSLLPALGNQVGAQAQVEQHIRPWFSVTGTLSGSYQPPIGGQKGVLSLGAGLGVVFHFDGFGSDPSAK